MGPGIPFPPSFPLGPTGPGGPYTHTEMLIVCIKDTACQETNLISFSIQRGNQKTLSIFTAPVLTLCPEGPLTPVAPWSPF